jgi:serine protease Do
MIPSIIALMLLILACASPAHAQNRNSSPAPSLRALSQLYQDLVERVDPAVVQIITRGYAAEEGEDSQLLRTQRGNGSGVVVDKNGYVITNAHVVGNARRVDVLLPQPAEERLRFRSVINPTGKLLPAKVVGVDRETDIAVLKIEESNLPVLPFADSDQLRQGQIVIAFGSPFGLENSVTMGIVSSVARQVRPDDPMIYIQTDAAINPGNSGGPLVDSEGAIAGINTFIVSTSGGNEGIGFAVPGNIARSVYEQIREHGRVRRGQIGVIAQSITPAMARALKLPQDWGVILADISPRSAAEAAGLRVKDLVLSFDGKPMENARQFGVNIYRSAGRTAKIEVLRAGRKIEIATAVLERPRDPDRILSLISGEQNVVTKLGVLAVDLDERVTPLLPSLRRLGGVVVAGRISGLSRQDDSLLPGDVIYEVNHTPVTSLAALRKAIETMPHGDPVVLHIERGGQLQFQVVEID